MIGIGNVTELAQAMQQVAEDYPNYNAQQIRHDFEQRFSRQAVVSQLFSLYQQVIRKM